jgi:hypothetical protein
VLHDIPGDNFILALASPVWVVTSAPRERSWTVLHRQFVSSHAVLSKPNSYIRPAVPLQVLFPGLLVIFHGSFELLALPAIGMVFIVTLTALHLTPHDWFDSDEERFARTYDVFRKISIVFMVFTVRRSPGLQSVIVNTGQRADVLNPSHRVPTPLHHRIFQMHLTAPFSSCSCCRAS